MAKREVVKLGKVERTSTGLRNALFDELDALRSGESNPTKANAVARLADQMCNIVQTELDVHKYMSGHPNAGSVALPPAIPLGSDKMETA